jgi:hypothetical protein
MLLYELFEENAAALLDISSANPSRRGERYYYEYRREIGFHGGFPTRC